MSSDDALSRENPPEVAVPDRRGPIPAGLARPAKIALIAICIVLGLVAFGFLGVPLLVKYALVHQIGPRLHRQISVADVHIDPIRLSLRVTGFDMKDRDGGPTALAFDDLYLKGDWTSIVRRAFLVKEVALRGPQVNLVRVSGDRYNVSDLLELFGSDQPQNQPTRFSVNNIEIMGGTVRFDDRPEHQTHAVTQIALGVPFVSSLPYDVDIFVKPAFSARIDGEPIALSGRTKPFKDSLETAVDVKLDGLQLPKYLAYAPAKLPVSVDSARLWLDLHVAFTRHDKRDPSLRVDGTIEVRDVAVRAIASAKGPPLFAADRVRVPIASADVFGHAFILGDIALEHPVVRVAREKDGTIDLARLAGPAASGATSVKRAAPADVASAPAPPLELNVASVKVSSGRVTFSDAVPSPAVELDVTHLDATLKDYRLNATKPSQLELTADIGPGERVAWHGTVRPAPLAADGEATLKGIHPARYAPYYAHLLPLPVDFAPLDVSARIAIDDGGKRVKISEASASTGSLTVREHDTRSDVATVEGLSLRGFEWSGSDAPIKLGALETKKGRALGTMKFSGVALRGAQLGPGGALIRLDGLTVRELAVGDMVRAESIEAGDVRVDVDRRAASLALFALSGGRVAIVRDTKGDLGFDRLVRLPVLPKQATGGPVGNRPASAPAAPWKVALSRLSMTRSAARFEDHTLAAPAVLTADGIELTVKGLSTEKGARADVDLQLVPNRGGRIHISGKAGIAPLHATWNVAAKDVAVMPFVGYFSRGLGIDVTSGAVSVEGKLTLDADGRGAFPARFAGDAGIHGFLSKVRTTGEEFLRWGALDVTGIAVATQPLAVDIRQVALSDFYSRLVLHSNGALNLVTVFAKPDRASGEAQSGATGAEGGDEGVGGSVSTTTISASGAAAAKPAAKSTTAAGATTATLPPSTAGPAPPVKIARVSIRSGRVNFSDFFVKPNYSANLTDLAGTVTGLSSDPSSSADIDIRGRIDGDAPLTIGGRVNPLKKDLSLDLKADVKDFQLAPLTPYSGKYLGYAIENGTLSFTVRYQVDNRTLTAQNQLVLNQLAFGDRIESATATKLPVLLAISLLKDRNGVIDVNLPISGTLDDPKFSVGGLLWRALLNLLGRAVTAPFALIGSAFGHSGDQLSYVDFDPGRAVLTQSARDKLGSLAKALAERPGLKLEIAGQYDPEADRAGLKRAGLEQKLRARKVEGQSRRKQAAGTADAPLDPAELDALTKSVYRKETFPKPKNFLGFDKDIPRVDMERLILANIPAGEDELRRLASERAQAARDFLVDQAKVAPERVTVAEPTSGSSGEKASDAKHSRVKFDLR